MNCHSVNCSLTEEIVVIIVEYDDVEYRNEINHFDDVNDEELWNSMEEQERELMNQVQMDHVMQMEQYSLVYPMIRPVTCSLAAIFSVSILIVTVVNYVMMVYYEDY